MSNTPLAWTLRAFDPPRDMRTAAHLKCGSCPEVGKLVISGMGHNPEKISQLFTRLGWDIDQHNAARCYCKKCVTNRKIRAQAEAAEEQRKAPAPGLIAAQRRQALSPPQEKKMTGPRAEVGIKALTADQKTALRNELGGTFDEALGRYLEGNSDRAISEKLSIPMAIVIEFRENFYGELRDDPEIGAFRLQIEDCRKVLRNLENSIDRMEEKLKELCKKAGL
jgi:hypothetical protein